MFNQALEQYLAAWTDEGPVMDRFRELLKLWPRCLFRELESGHLTSSAWVCSPDETEVLLTHHKKLGTWVQLGGHADGNPDLPAVARTEAREESGTTDLIAAGGDEWSIFDLDVHRIPPYRAVPAHYHYDVRFAYIAPVRAAPVVSDESHDVRWVPLESLTEYTSEESMLRMARKWRLRTAGR